MITIEAGAELDSAVAEAIAEDHEIYRVRPYSTDLNSAFAAAERAGLFDPDGPEAFLSQHPAGSVEWKVWWQDSAAPDGGHAVYKSTPALAICAAILKLKEEGDVRLVHTG